MLVGALVAGPAGPSEGDEINPWRRPSVRIRIWCSFGWLKGSVPPGRIAACHRFAPRMLAAFVILAGFVPVRSASAADVAHGAQLAQQWCISCHVLPNHPGQTALQGPPSFLDIAHGGKTSDQLRLFLLRPHGAMPPLTLSRAEIGDLIGYIETLR